MKTIFKSCYICNKPIHAKGLCYKHYNRLTAKKYYYKHKKEIIKHNKYLQNPEYKKNRKKLLALKPLCYICKKAPANEIHHKNYNKFNNSINNLLPLCRKCHKSYFHTKTAKKFFNEYHTDLYYLSLASKVSYLKCAKYYANNELWEMLRDIFSQR